MRNCGENSFPKKKQETHIPDEATCGITIKLTDIPLYYEYNFSDTGTKDRFLLDLIDSPGHVNFSS